MRLRRPAGSDQWLVLSPSHGAWISERVAVRTETTEFTSRLRPEVERLRFARASQADLDRVFDFELEGRELRRHLILELMPPGNIVVTDGEGKIRQLLREVKSGKRRLRRGDKYSPPPQSRLSPSDLTAAAFERILGRERTLGGALGRQVAIPKKYVREALTRLGLDQSSPTADALQRGAEIVQAVTGIVREAESSPSPCVAETGEGEELFAVVPKSSRVTRQAASMCALCDELFTDSALLELTEGPTPEETWRKERDITVKRLRSQEQGMLEEAQKLRAEAEEARSAGSLEEALKIFAASWESRKRARPEPRSREAVASALFAAAKEAEAKAGEARGAADALELKEPPKGAAGGLRTRELSRKRREWYEKFRWFFTSNGKLAIGGRDSQSNSLLVRRHLEGEDTVYHADLFGSPFFVLKRGSEQTAEEILELAQATVAFSSAWKTGLGSADAYWVTKDQVATSAPSGEFLARGSFLIKGKKNFVQRNLVQLAVGVDAVGRVVAAPESAVAGTSRSYVVIVPQREKASETARKVARELAKMMGAGQGPSVDDVLRALPSGGGKVVRTKAKVEDKPK